MYLLDTNVISELRKANSGRADAGVVHWFRSISSAQAFISAITLFELERGILLIERRDRRQSDKLRHWLERQVIPEFAGRILAVDGRVALRCAKLHVPDRRSDQDALIAATALVHDLKLVTRNTKDFLGTGALLINPWLEGADVQGQA